jgi:two-component system CheB/CheR fusion protein
MAKKEQNSLAGLDVLLVDDDLESLDALGEVMAIMGATVRLSSSASEALEQSAKLDFDVILSDVAMPGGDGLRLVKEFRDQPHTRKTICIAVTGMDTPAEREGILAAGFDAHVSKPVHVRELVELVLRLSSDRVESGV